MTSSTRSVDHATFTVDRTYVATPERVFRAFADLDAKLKWFGNPDDRSGEHELDFRVGGAERAVGPGPDGKTFRYDAVYSDIVENQRIVYTYDMHLDDVRLSVSLAVVELTPEGDRTHMHYTEHGAFLDGHDKVEYREHGTNELLDALGRSLEA